MTDTTKPSESKPAATPLESYSAEDQAFYRFWYGHMKNDRMTGVLANVDHATARYIWNAALPAPVGAQLCAPFPGMDQPWPKEKVDELEAVLAEYETPEQSVPDSKVGNFGDSSHAQLKQRLENLPLPNYSETSDTPAAFESKGDD